MSFLQAHFPTAVGVVAGLIICSGFGFRVPIAVPRYIQVILTMGLIATAFAPPAWLMHLVPPETFWVLRFLFGAVITLFAFTRAPQSQKTRF